MIFVIRNTNDNVFIGCEGEYENNKNEDPIGKYIVINNKYIIMCCGWQKHKCVMSITIINTKIQPTPGKQQQIKKNSLMIKSME